MLRGFSRRLQQVCEPRYGASEPAYTWDSRTGGGAHADRGRAQLRPGAGLRRPGTGPMSSGGRGSCRRGAGLRRQRAGLFPIRGWGHADRGPGLTTAGAVRLTVLGDRQTAPRRTRLAGHSASRRMKVTVHCRRRERRRAAAGLADQPEACSSSEIRRACAVSYTCALLPAVRSGSKAAHDHLRVVGGRPSGDPDRSSGLEATQVRVRPGLRPLLKATEAGSQ